MASDGDYTRVDRPADIEALLEILTEPGGASLELEGSDNKPHPVLVSVEEAGENLTLDISAIRDISGELIRGAAFRLLGQSASKMLRTPTLEIEQHYEQEGRLLCECPYPLHLEVLQRRESFRARLRLGMEVGATLRGNSGEMAQGDLRDLSLEGCQLDLPVSANTLLSADPGSLEIELVFPNDTRMTVAAEPRHQKADAERQSVLVGFRFRATAGEKERQLWYFVREIEREAARYDNTDGNARQPSPLFQSQTTRRPAVGRRSAQSYPTPMASRLARVAGYLDAQLIELQQGSEINSVQLSKYADRLLSLYDEDREELLFATRCLRYESRLIRHSIAVSVGLLELAGLSSVPQELRKAMVATAMVHDLGKGLLPAELWELEAPDEYQRSQMHYHVELLMGRMGRCSWLSRNIVNTVARSINERLDGSGYPRGLTARDLPELARAAAIVDVVDAMRRDRPDRGAWRTEAIYSHLLKHTDQFDRRWVERYIRQSGRYPVGSLLRFADDQLGWVRAVNEQGYPATVQLTGAAEPPGSELGEQVSGQALQRLGEIREEIPVSS